MATWHPIMNIREGLVGTWSMIGPLDEPYASIEPRSVGSGSKLNFTAHPH